MNQSIESDIKFYKLKNGEDIVAFEIESLESHYNIRRPLLIKVENEVLAGRQMLNVREWVPPIVCANDTVLLPKELVIFSTDVKVSFKEEFKDATDYLYNVVPKKKQPRTPSNSTLISSSNPSTKH
jgi:hypothetical protein